MMRSSKRRGRLRVISQTRLKDWAPRYIRRARHEILFWSVSLSWSTLVAWLILTRGDTLGRPELSLTPWIAILALIDLLPLKGWHAEMAPDLPVFIAGALLLTPLQMAIVG